MVSIPENLFNYEIHGRDLSPAFLTPADHPWLRRLLDEADRSIGAPRHVLAERLRDLEVHAPRGGLRRMAELVLLSRVRTERAPGPVPARVRSTLFQTAASMSSAPREEVIARAASTLSVDPAALERSLFADLPDERRITGLDECPTPEDLAVRTNLAFVQALLFRSSRIHLTFEGNARAIVRSVKLGGLICTVTPGEADSAAALEISGPFSLFRRTLMYGRALSAVVPFLAWARRFELHADCTLRGECFDLRLRSPVPIFPSREPRAFDSRVEERFARRFARLAPDWELIREPEPVAAGGTLIFPDFLARHRHDRSRSAWIEIVGFWSPDYLTKKLVRLREAKLENLILCIDETLTCSAEEAAPADARVLPFRRTIDPRRILRLLGEMFGSGPAG